MRMMKLKFRIEHLLLFTLLGVSTLFAVRGFADDTLLPDWAGEDVASLARDARALRSHADHASLDDMGVGRPR